MILLKFTSLSVMISFSLEIVITFLSFEFFLLFFEQYSKKTNESISNNTSSKFSIIQNKEPNQILNISAFRRVILKITKICKKLLSILQNRELCWGIMFFLIGNMMVLQIIGDFYFSEKKIRYFFIYGRNLEFILSLSLFSFSLESSELKTNNYLISKGFGLLSAAIFIFTVFSPQITIILLLLAIPLILFLLIQYGWITLIQTKKFRTFRYPFYALFLGFFLFIAGFLISQLLFNTRDLPNLDLSGRLVGDFIQLFGILLLAVAFFFLPSLNEFTWYDKLQKMFVIHPTGLCLFGYDFLKFQAISEASTDTDLTTSLLLAMNTIAQEITPQKSSKSDVIHKDNLVILFEFGMYCFIALFVSEDSITIRKKLREFSGSFERMFSAQLKKWSGNTNQFETAERLIFKIFTPDPL